MKKLTIIFLFIIPEILMGQEIIKSPYGDTVIIYRLSDKQINKLKNSNRQLYNAVSFLEKELDKKKYSITMLQNISPDDIVPFKTYILDADLGYDLQPYNAEIKFYYSYSAKRKVAKQREADSINNAAQITFKENQERQKKMMDSLKVERKSAESIEWENKKMEQQERSRIYDSSRLSNFEAEQKAYKTECIKKYGAKYGSIIANGDVVIGMSKVMVKEAWGISETTNETLVNGVRVDTWQYSYNKWVVFKNGTVVSVNK